MFCLLVYIAVLHLSPWYVEYCVSLLSVSIVNIRLVQLIFTNCVYCSGRSLLLFPDTLLYSTITLFGSTWLYTPCQPSTTFYHGSTGRYLTLLHSTMTLVGST